MFKKENLFQIIKVENGGREYLASYMMSENAVLTLDGIQLTIRAMPTVALNGFNRTPLLVFLVN